MSSTACKIKTSLKKSVPYVLAFVAISVIAIIILQYQVLIFKTYQNVLMGMGIGLFSALLLTQVEIVEDPNKGK